MSSFQWLFFRPFERQYGGRQPLLGGSVSCSRVAVCLPSAPGRPAPRLGGGTRFVSAPVRASSAPVFTWRRPFFLDGIRVQWPGSGGGGAAADSPPKAGRRRGQRTADGGPPGRLGADDHLSSDADGSPASLSPGATAAQIMSRGYAVL